MEDLIPGDVRLPRDGEPSGVIYEEEEEMDVDEAFDYEEGEFPCTDLLDDSGDSEDGGGNGKNNLGLRSNVQPATCQWTSHYCFRVYSGSDNSDL
uniref:Uncharacterized protein n=1 Tax=Oryza brachyantha TaxID=4533 RepID=J3N3R2_ORYBR